MDMMNHPHPGMIVREEVIKSLNLTVAEVADRLGMSRASISRVVNGRSAIIDRIWQMIWSNANSCHNLNCMAGMACYFSSLQSKKSTPFVGC